MRTLLLFLILISLFAIQAQSLKDNPYYIKSLALKNQSREAFDQGEYEKSLELSNESVLYATKSDEWIEMMLNRYKANSALTRAQKRLDYAVKVKGDINYLDDMIRSRQLIDRANQLYIEESYIESYSSAIQAYENLLVVKYQKNIPTLPAAYVVKDIPGNEDCLWKIAEYDFIFGDAHQWELLYEANREILPQIDNPDLILAGLVLEIPSINGEVRSGTWINGSIQ